MEKLFKRLSLSKAKNSADQQYTREMLNKLTQEIAKEAPDERIAYNISWLEARWQLFSGELKTSVNHYKLAFELCLYTAGTEQQRLFKEACVVAAKAKDSAFMKRLKHQAVAFGWLDAPSNVKQDNVNNKKSCSKDNIVEDWEVDRWIDGFNKMLPQSSMFPGCVIDRAKDRVGPLMSTFEEAEKLKPVFCNLDRAIKHGSWRKQMPQLVWFIYQNKLNYVQQLLERGASVNVASEFGETPILMAIQHMDVTCIPFKEPDDRYFNLVAAYEHDTEIINMCLSKTKQIPLICAVETAKPEVVKKVLELGADVDRRGQFEEHTALYASICQISRITNPSKSKLISAQLTENPPKMLLDCLQRTQRMGMTLDDTARILKAQKSDEFYQVTEAAVEMLYCKKEQLLNPAKLREIAMILLEFGADPNAEHTFEGLEGYTPLMLAAEDDEVEIFEKMLEKGGDPLKSCYFPKQDFYNNSFQLAVNWRSFKVLALLSRKFPEDFDRFVTQVLEEFKMANES